MRFMFDFLAVSLRSFLNLILPNCCLHCDVALNDRGVFLCNKCLKSLPYTNYHLYPFDNELVSLLNKSVNIHSAVAMCYFSDDNMMHNIIHSLKYKDMSKLGCFLGETYGDILVDFDFVRRYDVIVPIPLHKFRFNQRGYNQSEMIARGLASSLGIDVDTDSVMRIVNTSTQTNKNAEERMRDMQGAFKVVKPSNLNGKHLLLVDDVVTTGSTMISCAREILKSCRRVKVSVCSICRTCRD